VTPLYFLAVSSLKDNTSIFNAPFALPRSFDLGNFAAAWDRATLGPALANSTYTSVASIVLALILGVPASYAIARSKGRLGAFVERFFALGLLVPVFAALVPTLLLSVALHLFHTREFLIMFLSATALPLTVILLTQFMKAVPAELEESAMLDGAGRLRILLSVYVPVTMPGIVTVVILDFLSFWNEYLFALVLVGPDPAKRTAQVARPTLVDLRHTDYGVVLAGCLIMMLPTYALYVVLQRRVEDALILGAVKG
jgi:multiple sugar transport system permease protein